MGTVSLRCIRPGGSPPGVWGRSYSALMLAGNSRSTSGEVSL